MSKYHHAATLTLGDKQAVIPFERGVTHIRRGVLELLRQAGVSEPFEAEWERRMSRVYQALSSDGAYRAELGCGAVIEIRRATPDEQDALDLAEEAEASETKAERDARTKRYRALLYLHVEYNADRSNYHRTNWAIEANGLLGVGYVAATLHANHCATQRLPNGDPWPVLEEFGEGAFRARVQTLRNQLSRSRERFLHGELVEQKMPVRMRFPKYPDNALPKDHRNPYLRHTWWLCFNADCIYNELRFNPHDQHPKNQEYARELHREGFWDWRHTAQMQGHWTMENGVVQHCDALRTAGKDEEGLALARQAWKDSLALFPNPARIQNFREWH